MHAHFACRLCVCVCVCVYARVYYVYCVCAVCVCCLYVDDKSEQFDSLLGPPPSRGLKQPVGLPGNHPVAYRQRGPASWRHFGHGQCPHPRSRRLQALRAGIVGARSCAAGFPSRLQVPLCCTAGLYYLQMYFVFFHACEVMSVCLFSQPGVEPLRAGVRLRGEHLSHPKGSEGRGHDCRCSYSNSWNINPDDGCHVQSIICRCFAVNLYIITSDYNINEYVYSMGIDISLMGFCTRTCTHLCLLKYF